MTSQMNKDATVSQNILGYEDMQNDMHYPLYVDYANPHIKHARVIPFRKSVDAKRAKRQLLYEDSF